MDFNAEQAEKVEPKSITFGLLAKRFSGIDFNVEQFLKVPMNSVTSGLLAKRFSGMEVNDLQP